MFRACFIFLLFSLGFSTVFAVDLDVDSDRWSKQYDPIFKKYTKRYFGPFFDWRWFKSQDCRIETQSGRDK